MRETRRIHPSTFLKKTLLSLTAILVPIALYMMLLLRAWTEFGTGRILGWDSLFYAFSTQETLRGGIPWFLRHWNHPNAYALVLAAFSYISGDISRTVNVLPVGLVVLLSIASGFVGKKVDGPAVGFLAFILTATSITTLRLFVDLHRALFAFLGVTFLIALDSPKLLSRTRLDRNGVLALVLLFAVAFSEIEIYVAMFLATMVTLGLRRERLKHWAFSLAWSLVPGGFFALTPAPSKILDILLFGASAGLVPEFTAQELSFYFDPILLVPFVIFGVVSLAARTRYSVQGTSTPLIAWNLSILLLLITFGFFLRMIELYRGIALLHLPIFAAVGAGSLIRSISNLHERASKTLPKNHLLRFQIPNQTRQMAFSLFATALIVSTGLALNEKAGVFLRPMVPDTLHTRLELTSSFIRGKGWPEPIYLYLNEQIFDLLHPIRFELGLANNNPSYLYYGDLNFLPWFIYPDRIYPDGSKSVEKSIALDSQYFITSFWLDPGPLDLLRHPVVVLSPELFTRTLPPSFDEYRVGEGIHIIPPNALSLDTFLSWEILASEDYYILGETAVVDRAWSSYGKVLETYASGGYGISFLHYFPMNATYEIALRLFDFPQSDYASGVNLSPLELLVGDETVATLSYSRNEVVWWNVTLDYAQAGLHAITVRALDDDLPFRMSLDKIVVTAVSSMGASPPQPEL